MGKTKMRTSAEIEAEKQAEADRQARYDVLLARRDTLKAAIPAAERRVAELKSLKKKFESMMDIVGDLPQDGHPIRTGHEFRWVVHRAVEDVLGQVGRDLRETEAELKKARVMRDETKKALADEFEVEFEAA